MLLRGAFPILVQLLASQNNSVNEQTLLESALYMPSAVRPTLRRRGAPFRCCCGSNATLPVVSWQKPLCLGLHISDGDCFQLFSACFRTDESNSTSTVEQPARDGQWCVLCLLHLQARAFDQGGGSHVYTQRCVGVPRHRPSGKVPACKDSACKVCEIDLLRGHVRHGSRQHQASELFLVYSFGLSSLPERAR